MQRPRGRCVLAFPRNSRKAAPVAMEWERGVFVEDAVRQGGPTR